MFGKVLYSNIVKISGYTAYHQGITSVGTKVTDLKIGDIICCDRYQKYVVEEIIKETQKTITIRYKNIKSTSDTVKIGNKVYEVEPVIYKHRKDKLVIKSKNN